MKCRECGRDISVMKPECPHCGTSTTPILEGKKGGQAFSNTKPRTDISGKISDGVTRRPFLWRLDQGSPPEEAELEEIGDILSAPLDREIFQISNFVFFSPHVQNNLAYRQRAAQVNLAYAYQVDAVNAFATDNIPPGMEAEPPLIVLFEGLVRATRLTAIGLALDRRQKTSKARRQLTDLVRTLGKSIVRGSGDLAEETMLDLCENMNLRSALSDHDVQSRARSYRAAMLMGIISHELGHVALAHTLGAPVNIGISRNQEREADSFAASVISSSPFSDYLVIGIIFFWLILTWVDTAVPEEAAKTHPHAGERLFDFIRNNREQAESIGFTEETIAEFMPG